MSVELWTGKTEALELLATGCELELAADEAVMEMTLLDPVLETVDPNDEELAACTGAAYRLTSVASRSLAGTEAARITRRKNPLKSTTAIWTRL